MFHPSVIERFARCALGLSVVARRTLRTNQRFIALAGGPAAAPRGCAAAAGAVQAAVQPGGDRRLPRAGGRPAYAGDLVGPIPPATRSASPPVPREHAVEAPAFDEGPRRHDGRDLRRPAGRQHRAAPAEKFSIAGTRPNACRPSHVTMVATAFGSITPTAALRVRQRLAKRAAQRGGADASAGHR